MISFAVWHEGMPENAALWVLSVDEATNQFLLCGEQGFYWRSIDGCKMMRVHGPDNATLVADMADMQQRTAGIVVPNSKGF